MTSRRSEAAEIHAAVADSWEQVLGIAPDGDTANFFEDGGNSLAAVELLTGIRERLGRSLRLQELYVAPTVHDMVAALIADLDGVPTSHHATGRTVVSLRRTGAGRLWCFLPPLSGAVTRYASMARLLPLSDAVWACETPAELSARGLQPLASGLAEALWDQGVADFAEVALVGYSLGGAIALEVARALGELGAARGRELTNLSLMLLDPVSPQEPPGSPGAVFELFVRNGWQVPEPAEAFITPDGDFDLGAVAEAARAAGTLPATADAAEVENSWKVYAANRTLLADYKVSAVDFDLRTAMLRCVGEAEQAATDWVPSEPPEDWSSVVSADRCWAIPVDHFAMLEAPHDELVATWLVAVSGEAS